ncbi:Crp/Fnr family transcriptional regulator [Armatimonadetes bacterium]|nr:Crp/Fnr family transcriptional regulator [bacterium]
MGGNRLVQQKDDTAFLLDTLSFWKDLTDTQKKHLQENIVKKQFVTGESMHSNSDHCSGLFLIQSGQVRAYIVSESGKEITLYRLFERDVCIFSASCMMKNIAFDIFIEVEKNTQVFLIPTAHFRKLSAESLSVQVFTNNLMASRFSDVMWIMEQALFTSFDKRLASFLVEQVIIESANRLEITHEKIANHLGTAREVVTRMLKYFQNEGMVTLNRGAIEILDLGKLERLIEG